MLDFLRHRTQSEHERIVTLLSAYLDGELKVEEQRRVEGHLAQCDTCAEELRTLKYTKALSIEAPPPRIPRSFVIRRADLEVPAGGTSRRLLGLSPKLAYAYMRGATALVAVAFAVLVAGDLMRSFSTGGRQPAMAPVKETWVVEQAIVAEVTAVVEKAVEEPVVGQDTPLAVEVQKEVEKTVMPDATPSPAVRQTPPPAEGAKEEAVQALAVPEAASEEATDATGDTLSKESVGTPEAYRAGDTPLPVPTPTATPSSPTPVPPTPTSPPPATLEPPTHVALRKTKSRLGISTLRIAEIGLGTLVLVLLVVTLIFRRQQP